MSMCQSKHSTFSFIVEWIRVWKFKVVRIPTSLIIPKVFLHINLIYFITVSYAKIVIHCTVFICSKHCNFFMKRRKRFTIITMSEQTTKPLEVFCYRQVNVLVSEIKIPNSQSLLGTALSRTGLAYQCPLNRTFGADLKINVTTKSVTVQRWKRGFF